MSDTPHMSGGRERSRRVAFETVVAALLAWTAWVLLWLLISAENWGVHGPNSAWETFRPYLSVMAIGAVPVAIWAVPTLLVGLLLRRGTAMARALGAALVAVVLCLVPAFGLISTAAEQSGGSGWRLVLFLTACAPPAAFGLYGTAAAITLTWVRRSRSGSTGQRIQTSATEGAR